MSNDNELCCSCRTPKTERHCELCGEAVCRKCVIVLPEETFAYLPVVPEQLNKTWYCSFCYDSTVAPELEKYNQTMEQAKEVIVMMKTFRGHIPLLKKSKTSVTCGTMDNRDDVIMRLAFFAALEGYNAIIQTELTTTKIRNHGYQKTQWSGVAIPADIDEARLKLDEYREEVWRRGF